MRIRQDPTCAYLGQGPVDLAPIPGSRDSSYRPRLHIPACGGAALARRGSLDFGSGASREGRTPRRIGVTPMKRLSPSALGAVLILALVANDGSAPSERTHRDVWLGAND